MEVLILEARYHAQVADCLADGATAALEKGGARFERVAVPGVLEIPAAIALAARASTGRSFAGYVALGCVLGDGTRYPEILAAQTMTGLMSLGADHGLCIGNGVILAPDERAAFALADAGQADAGGDAARACLALIELRVRLGMGR